LGGSSGSPEAASHATRPIREPRRTPPARSAALWFLQCSLHLRHRESNRVRVLTNANAARPFRPAFVPRTTGRRQEMTGTAEASNPQVRTQIRASSQVAKSAPRTLSRWRLGFEPRCDYKQRRRSDGPSRLSGESADPFVPHLSCGRPQHVAASEAETIALRPRFRTGPVEGLAVREFSRYASSILLQINAERVVRGLVKQVGLARSDICATVCGTQLGPRPRPTSGLT
jgi:hypothetical protein